MEQPDDTDAVAEMRAAIESARGYADFFGWPDREVAELGVVESLAESLAADSAGFFLGVRSRGRYGDPPDCEAMNADSQRIAIEVTELVSSDAIRATKRYGAQLWQTWDEALLLSKLTDALGTKDGKHSTLKGGPYPGGYVVLIHTDEPLITSALVQSAVAEHRFAVQHISRAFLLLSYAPSAGRCPYFELTLTGSVDTAGGRHSEPP